MLCAIAKPSSRLASLRTPNGSDSMRVSVIRNCPPYSAGVSVLAVAGVNA